MTLISPDYYHLPYNIVSCQFTSLCQLIGHEIFLWEFVQSIFLLFYVQLWEFNTRRSILSRTDVVVCSWKSIPLTDIIRRSSPKVDKNTVFIHCVQMHYRCIGCAPNVVVPSAISHRSLVMVLGLGVTDNTLWAAHYRLSWPLFDAISMKLMKKSFYLPK